MGSFPHSTYRFQEAHRGSEEREWWMAKAKTSLRTVSLTVGAKFVLWSLHHLP